MLFRSPFYKFSMTPKISYAAVEMNQIDITDAGYLALQTTPAHYHNLYRYFDTSKLLFLLIFIIIVLITITSESQEESK